MKEIRISKPDQTPVCDSSVVAIGKFDGIHIGHKKIIEELVKQKQKGMVSVIITFDRSFNSYFSNTEDISITTLEEKKAVFEEMGIDLLLIYELNECTVGLEAEKFIGYILYHKLHTKCIVAGEDISFGRKALGNRKMLEEYSSEYGYEAIFVPKVIFGENNLEISSTMVRGMLEKADMESAALLLGRHYGICAEIIHGMGLGHKELLPTLNQLWPKGKMLVPFGVYISAVYIDNEKFYGLTNIGKKPTVDNSGNISVETYVHNFNRDVYGKTAEISLLHFVRPEKKFTDIEQLKEQIKADVEGLKKQLKKNTIFN